MRTNCQTFKHGEADLYLVVHRDLGANQPFISAALALRLSKVYRDESPLARRLVVVVAVVVAGFLAGLLSPLAHVAWRHPSAIGKPSRTSATCSGKVKLDEPPKQDDPPPQGAAAMSVRAPVPSPTSSDMSEPVIDLPPDGVSDTAWTPAALALARHIGDEDDTDWHAFHSGPVYIPPSAFNNFADVNHDRAPPSDGAP
ncbi:hypothetical protein CYMTET_16141 [Cymbomonas tetramitiformis]|uniref:Uncharacterized protein n=1 Tax=Cymbomonas tetramitiformis TaxID=36881 RepID=A0AAE0GCT4_9CHLO|nr:hypothetical protein CYMTET_16141 [Cymbomonas tetramitiformis]